MEGLDDKVLDELYYQCGLKDYVEFVFEEFPICSDTPNCDYDVGYAWETFTGLNRKGMDVEESVAETLHKLVSVVENIVVVEYIDDDFIAEAYSGSDHVDEFLKKNPVGKKLSAKDKYAMKSAFENGDCVTFENGYSWCPSEFVEVQMSEGDEEGYTVKDIHDYVHEHEKNLYEYVSDNYICNSELSKMYGGIDVYTCWSINLEDIARLAH